MKKEIFTKEEKWLYHLILHSHDVPQALGLFNGMTGIMLVLAHYARCHNMPEVEKVADFLIDEITENMNNAGPINFSDGMAGIGWAIEYLIQNGYMKGCGADLMEEPDKKIMEHDIRRMTDDTLETGIEGLCHYIILHIQGAMLLRKTVFDKMYLDDLTETLLKRQKEKPNEQKWTQLHTMLTNVRNGQQIYKPDLKQFVHPVKTVPLKLLGLHNGLAGYIELRLPEGEKGHVL